jgi:hypothetical protein
VVGVQRNSERASERAGDQRRRPCKDYTKPVSRRSLLATIVVVAGWQRAVLHGEEGREAKREGKRGKKKKKKEQGRKGQLGLRLT